MTITHFDQRQTIKKGTFSTLHRTEFR